VRTSLRIELCSQILLNAKSKKFLFFHKVGASLGTAKRSEKRFLKDHFLTRNGFVSPLLTTRDANQRREPKGNLLQQRLRQTSKTTERARVNSKDFREKNL
jgi:hypothetical protein